MNLDELLYCSSFRNIKITHNEDGDSGDNLLKEKTIPTVIIHPTIRNPEESVKGWYLKVDEISLFRGNAWISERYDPFTHTPVATN